MYVALKKKYYSESTKEKNGKDLHLSVRRKIEISQKLGKLFTFYEIFRAEERINSNRVQTLKVSEWSSLCRAQVQCLT